MTRSDRHESPIVAPSRFVDAPMGPDYITAVR